MSEIILLHDYKAKLGQSISPQLLTRDMRIVVSELVKKARTKKLIDSTDLDEVAGELMGYELYGDDRWGCSGYCDMSAKSIIIQSGQSLAHEQITLCHELGHAIQAHVGHYDSVSWLLSDFMRDEQQAETMGAMLLNGLFPNTPTAERGFTYGFRQEDAIFLREWYGDWVENDLYTSN